jgi:hypothetical protein
MEKNVWKIKTQMEEKALWPEPASELYWPSDRRLLAKLVLTFVDRRVSRSQRGGSPMVVISIL